MSSPSWVCVWGYAHLPANVTDFGWNWVEYLPWLDEFICYANSTVSPVTFENALIAMPSVITQQANDPWRVIAGSGTINGQMGQSGDNFMLTQNLDAGQMIFTCSVSRQSKAWHASGFLVVEDEVMAYSAMSPNVVGATSATFTISQRGARGTQAVAHLVRNPGPAPINNNTWVTLASPNPSGQDFPGDCHPARNSAVDTKRSRLWWFGGYSENRQYDTTWYMDADESIHRFPILAPYTSTVGRMPQRQEGAGCYCVTQDCLAYFGGLGAGNPQNDLFLLPLGDTLPPGATVANKWNKISTSGAVVGRNGHKLIYDPDREKLYIVGGLSSSGVLPQNIAIYDIASRAWSVSSSAPFAGLKWPAAAYNQNAKLVMWYTGPDNFWTWNPQTNAWTNVGISGGPLLWASDGTGNNASIKAAYDNVHDRFPVLQSPNKQNSTWNRPETWAIQAPIATNLVIIQPVGNPARLPDGADGQPYNFPCEATGSKAPYLWEATNLPPGLNIDSATGVISGTTTAEGQVNGIIKVTGADMAQAQVQYTLYIAPAPLAITSPAGDPAVFPNGTVGQPYSFPCEANGGKPPYLWSMTNLPPEYAIDPNTGIITGTAGDGDADQNFSGTLSCMDSLGSVVTKKIG